MTNVDLFIPTYNRPDFLKRILTYYNYYNLKFPIIIADSSSIPNKKNNRKTVSSFSKLNITYINSFSPNLPSHYKFREMLKLSKSKYSVFCADDDFIVPNGIEEAVKFLEKNPEYVAAHGTYISFYIQNSLFNSKKFWWKYIYPYTSITSSNPLHRLTSNIIDYAQVLWAVRRTDIVRRAYEEFLKSKADPYLFGELLPNLLTLIFGKMKRLNTFYAARQAFSTSYSYWPSLKDAINTGIYDKEYSKFKICLIENLDKNSYLSKERVSKTIDSDMEIYLRNANQEYLVARINLALKPFPKFFLRGLRLLHAKYLFSKDKKDRIGSVNNPSSRYFNDFEVIRQTVLRHM